MPDSPLMHFFDDNSLVDPALVHGEPHDASSFQTWTDHPAEIDSMIDLIVSDLLMNEAP